MTAADESARHRSLKPPDSSTPNNGSLARLESVLENQTATMPCRECRIQKKKKSKRKGGKETARLLPKVWADAFDSAVDNAPGVQFPLQVVRVTEAAN
jgi:hypothetical protein